MSEVATPATTPTQSLSISRALIAQALGAPAWQMLLQRVLSEKAAP